LQCRKLKPAQSIHLIFYDQTIAKKTCAMHDDILDKLDYEILSLLQTQGDLNYKELAYKLHKSPSTIFERINRMRERGFIAGNITIINREKFKELLVSYTHVTLRDHSSNALTNFQEKVAVFPQVLECYHTTGDYDFLLKIVVRDMQEYTRFITRDLMTQENVLKSHSSFVVNEVKRDLAYPLESR